MDKLVADYQLVQRFYRILNSEIEDNFNSFKNRIVAFCIVPEKKENKGKYSILTQEQGFS